MARRSNREIGSLAAPDWASIKPDMKPIFYRGQDRDYNRLLWEAEYYVHNQVPEKDLVSAYIKYCAKHFGKDKVEPLKEAPDYRLHVPGKYAYLALKGVVLKEETAAYLKSEFDKLCAEFQPEETPDAPVEVRVVNIQERMREQVSGLCGDWEGRVDEIIQGQKFDLDKFDAYKELQNNDTAIKAAHARMIRDAFANQRAEIQEVLDGEDEQLTEAYARHKPKTLNKLLNFYDKILTACDTIINAGKAVRKTRKRRALNKEKMVKNLKFLAQEPKLGLASINPQSIVGASVLWTYDVKKRKLSVFNAPEGAYLGVKGAAIQNYDETTSFQKTVRKPEILKGADRLARTKIQKLFEGIRSTEVKARPRMTADTILIKVF